MEALVHYWTEQHNKFPLLKADALPMFNRGGGDEEIRADIKRFCRASRELDHNLCTAIGSLIEKEKTTLYLLLISALGAVLHLDSRLNKITIGTYFANRTHPDVERLIGDFAHFHTIGLDFTESLTISELLQHAKQAIANGSAHQEIPRQVVHAILLRRKLVHRSSDAPFAPFVWIQLRTQERPLYSQGAKFSLGIPPIAIRPTPVPLNITCFQSSQKILRIDATYDTKTISPESMEIFMSTLTTVLKTFSQLPTSTKVSALNDG
jgi:non-ribosomal peptide synthetase component F